MAALGQSLESRFTRKPKFLTEKISSKVLVKKVVVKK